MKKTLLRFMAVLAVFNTTTYLQAQGSAFTYQGRLNGTSGPATGTYDFEFAVYDAASAGNIVSGPITNSAVTVSNGLFTTLIDFGSAAFNGNSRWLEIAVSTNGAGTFFTLSPRQAFTPTPYSITAATITGPISAAQITGPIPAASITGTYGNQLTLNNANNQFTGSFTGNGTGVSNVNAATLNGLGAAGFWKLGGNNVANGQFIGSTNNQPVEIWANRSRVLRIEPGLAPNILGGSILNYIAPGVVGATIAGGGSASGPSNSISANYGTISGGWGNWVSNTWAVVAGGSANVGAGQSSAVGGGSLNMASGTNSLVGGGYNNQSTGNYATVGGGGNNQAAQMAATVGGGENNSASGVGATVAGGGTDGVTYLGNLATGNGSAIGGGNGNLASGLLSVVAGGNNNAATNQFATVAGGQFNTAGGTHSFAAGRKAVAANNGSFVWADETDAFFQTTANNQFLVRASGGVGFNTNNPNGSALNVAGNINATSFSGDGGNISNLDATKLTGTVPSGQLSGTYSSALTLNNSANSFTGNTLSISGNKTGGWPAPVATIVNANTSSTASPALRVVASGTLIDGALNVSANGSGLIARFGNASSFVADVTTNGTVDAVAFSGDGSALTGLNASQLTSGIIPNNRLSGTYVGAVTFSNPSCNFLGNYNVSPVGDLRLNDRALYFRTGGDVNHGLAYNGAGVTNFGTGNVQVDGPVLWGFSGGALGVVNGGAKAAMTWNNTGVTVNGNETVTGNLSANNTPGVSWNQNWFSPDMKLPMNQTTSFSQGNYKPAPGYFLLMANVCAYPSSGGGGTDLDMNLVDVSGSSPVYLVNAFSHGNNDGEMRTVSLSWIVPINAAGGYQNFAIYLSAYGSDWYIRSYNLSVMYFPRLNN